MESDTDWAEKSSTGFSPGYAEIVLSALAVPLFPTAMVWVADSEYVPPRR